ncbi:MAG: DUF4870 domain-containing protein [Propioniciclava sp.]
MSTPQPDPSSQNVPFPQDPPSARPTAPLGADTPPPFPDTPVPPPSGQVYSGSIAPSSFGSGQQTAADDRTWAIFAHLSAVVASVLSAGWLTFLGPLIIHLIKRDTSPFARSAAAGAFNFALSMALVSIVGTVLSVTVVLAVIGIPMLIVGALLPIILGVVGAVKTSQGEQYVYPFQLKVL